MSLLTLIKPGDIVLDYAGFRLNDQNIEAIEATLGGPIKCVVRYIAQTSGFNKLATKEEIDFLHSRRIAVLLVYEWSATRANGGAVNGTVDGQFSSAKCQELNYPVDIRLAVIVAIDTNTTLTNVGAHEAYSVSFDRNLVPYESEGIYGDSDIIAYCIENNVTILNWLVGARSWGHLLDGVHVEQLVLGSTAEYDLNKVWLPFYAWLPEGDVDMSNPVIIHFEVVKPDGTKYPGSYFWGPGMEAPLPFASAEDRDTITFSFGVTGGGVMTEEMYNRLFSKKDVPPPVGQVLTHIKLNVEGDLS